MLRKTSCSMNCNKSQRTGDNCLFSFTWANKNDEGGKKYWEKPKNTIHCSPVIFENQACQFAQN